MKIWIVLLVALSQRLAPSESLHLRWGPSPTTGIIGYKVLMRPGDGSYPDFYTIGVTNTNEFRTVDLPSGAYKFKVLAYDKNGAESEPCEEIELVIPVLPPVHLQVVTNETSTVIWPRATALPYRGMQRKPVRQPVPPLPPIK